VQRHVATGTVLNVGDTSFELSLHLPKHEVTCLDVLRPRQVPPGERFLREDFTRTWIRDGAFTCVVALDVLEHIEPRLRTRFLVHAARAASTKAFIAFPAGDDAASIEELIRRSRTRTNFRRALEEHCKYGLPVTTELSEALDAENIGHRWSPLTTVWEWLASFVFDDHDSEDIALVDDYCEFLNERAAEEPGTGPIYRYLLEMETQGDARD
jgi:hypothetical protein